jgi:hypothetical protein
MLQAKQIENQNTDHYELFEIKTIKDINDNDVQVSQSIGTYSVEDLERQKESLQEEITEIDEKITAIESL